MDYSLISNSLCTAMRSVQQKGKPHSSGMLLLLSIDNIDALYATHSPNEAAKIITSFANGLAHRFPSLYLIQPVGLDMFALLFLGISDVEMTDYANKIYSFSKHFGFYSRHQSVYLKISLGSTAFQNTDDLAMVIQQAIVALRHSHRTLGTFYTHYHGHLPICIEGKDSAYLASYFQQALATNALRLAYQPVICSKTGLTSSYECLLRIVECDGTIISAGPFIPTAEEMEFITEIDFFVLEKVIEELKLSPHVCLGFNVSNQTIDDPLWVARAHELLGDPNIASRVTLEITETGYHKNLHEVSRFVVGMQELGCQVALDDFGTGYTSFQQLMLLPIDIVKIDGSFVKSMLDNMDSRLFLETLIEFTKKYGLKTVAEFVETGEIAKSLMALDVDYLQGHYFSPAMNHRPWVVEDAGLEANIIG